MTPVHGEVLAILCEHQPGLATVRLDGELCLLSAPALDFRLRALHALSPTDLVVIDAWGLRLLTAAGVHVLADAHARARRAGGRLQVRSPQPLPAEVLCACGLADLLAPHDRPERFRTLGRGVARRAAPTATTPTPPPTPTPPAGDAAPEASPAHPG
jgi:anti-anti-sigma factor